MDAVEVVHLATPKVVDQKLLRFHVHVDTASDLVQRLKRHPGGTKEEQLG